MAKWLDKYEQGGLVLKKKTKDNYGKRENPNDIKASVGPDFVGLGYNTKGRDYSPAWGGQFQDGGEIPQAQNGWLEKLTSTLNPYNWRVEDYSKEKDFTKAYSTAKKAGEEEFMYKGKRYNTKYAGTPRQEVGTYGVDGKPVHPMDLNHPAQVNLYPAFGKYLPGHISASVGDNETSIDYSSTGNFPFGINEVKNKGEKSFNVYGQDNLTFSNKAASLPTGDYMLEDKYTPSDWNLFINNCADNVCDAFGIPRSKGIQTPSGAVSKIKKKYPTLDITGKAYEDYYDLSEKLQSSFPEKILPQAKNILGIASSPDLKKLKPKFISSIQQALYESGYELPKSKLKNNNNFDGVLGDETKAALLDWQKKNKSLAMGGALPGAVGFTYARTQDPAPSNGPYAKKTLASAQSGKNIPTQADSLALYDNSKKVMDYYNSKNYKETDKSYLGNNKIFNEYVLKNNQGAVSLFNELNRKSNQRMVPMTNSKDTGKAGWVTNLPLSLYYKEIDKNKYFQRELAQHILDTRAPMQLFDKRITPTLSIGYENISTLDSMKGDGVEIMTYDPVLVKPVNMLTPEERAFRIKKYGKDSGIKETVSKPIQKPVSKPTPKPEPTPVVEQQPVTTPIQQPAPQPKQLYNYDDGEQLMAPIPNGWGFGTMGGGAVVGVRKKDGTIEYIKPEDYKRMGVPKYGQDYIKSKQKMQKGGVIKDDRGQWAHPGEVTEIGSNDITMQGVDYPVLGVSDTGDTQMMYPDQDYKFNGEKVTEYPMAQNGDWLSKYATEPMRQDATRNVVPRKMTDKERLEAVATSDQAQKKALNTAKEVITERQKNKATKGDLNTPGSWNIKEKARLFPSSVGGAGEMFDEYVNPATYVGILGDALGESVAARDPKGIALSLALSAGAGAMGLDPLGSTIKGVKAIPKVTRAGLNAIDRNFSNVGKELVRIEKEGLKKGLSPEAIKAIQLEEVGITANQREAYVPGVSDALQKYVYPQGYGGGAGESKLAQTIRAIKTGTRTKSIPSREDAWRTYLGMPQEYNTFRMAETAPVNHPAYTPKELSKMDIYSINDKFLYKDDLYSNLEGIGPRAIDETTMGNPESIISRLEKNSKMVTDPISYDYNYPVMGGYNKRLNQYGLEYNDIWDLEPEVLGKKIKIDNFIGKPFMSHEVLPDITSEKVKSLVTSQIKSADGQFKSTVDWYKDLMDKGSMIDYSQTLEGYKSALNKVNELKGKLGMDQDIMMNSNGWGTKDWNKTINNTSFNKENGGWLNKYK